MARPKEFDESRALDDALDVFWEKGYESTSIQDLVSATGVNRASLYESFGSKRQLFLKALDRFAACNRNIAHATAGVAPGLARIRAALRLAGEQAAADVRGCMIVNAIVEGAAQDCEMQAMGGATRQRFEDFFAESLAEAERLGQIRAGRDRLALARFLTNTLFGLRVTAKTRAGEPAIRAIVETTLGFIEKGLNPVSSAAIHWLYGTIVPEQERMAGNMGKLNGKVAVITGGTTGIGLATAKLFQQEGAQVVVTGRSLGTLAEAQQELGPAALVVQSDTGKLDDIDKLIGQVRARFGRIDILFANAGVGKVVPIEHVDEALFDEQFRTNVKGLYFTVQKAIPLIPDGGAILLNASVVSKKGFAGMSVYSATKAAVRSFGRTLAAELAPRRIRVNTISPGPIETPILGKMGLPPEAAKQFEENMAQSVALKRLGQPDEIARAALFLVSEDASFVLGTEMFVDGGVAEL
ncbi:MAG TPA: SDR family oxidoreductase [Bryobacteraceae bacterium]|nr:SDR family oxidoreductase [Bryobacteraceae bacterium]